MKEFLGEIFDPVIDFYKMRKKNEIVISVVIPMILGFLCFAISQTAKSNGVILLKDFTQDFLNQLITMLTLFVSFTMAYLSIIVSSSSENINRLKRTRSEDYYINVKKDCTLYQVLISEITYTLIIEIIFLILVVFQKFLNILTSSIGLKIIISTDVAIFVHVLVIMLVVVKNFYFTFWKSDPEDDEE
ncbi:hypothetical protein [Anaerostipes caccae]|uniref:hypothetical protein n=1 Tax=Anaerostipes caccae TaxID=105841 RepID=UPI001D05D170|nr:hypothetical protein [Anaerostipes caccae]WAX05215.1 hypothetical protein AC844P1_00004 [Anaerostipes phage AC844P1]WAX05274.1 hypothetical protein AC844P2_00004 [Anaerostipes phage AC844P2]WAX05333.1 hypothetical protein AC844P3_00004 [Anaerostipes phage AC844P3]MCB6293802.1 hypothetical protein [Anaerostipes caccae]MCB6336445.1 hypothetical protein [Anaerostipes caccae]